MSKYTAEKNTCDSTQWIVWENIGEEKRLFARFHNEDYSYPNASEIHAKRIAEILNSKFEAK